MTMLAIRARSAAAATAAALLLLAGSTASAQDALGDGTALDRNLREGVTNVNATPIRATGNSLGQRVFDSPGAGRALDYNLQAGSGGFNSPGRTGNMRGELAFRNAIVTGNAPGGRSFRGNVGYTAANDFRGVTGSDTTFRFERDSFYSGVATRNVRGLGAIQYQLGQTTGSQVEGFDQRLIMRRPASGVDIAEVRNPARAAATEGIDPFSYLNGSLRSTTAFDTRSSEFPAVIAQVDTREGAERRQYLIASPLAGLKAYPAWNPFLGISTEPQPIPGVQPGAEAEERRPGNLSAPLNERLNQGSTYQDLLQTLRERSNRLDTRATAALVNEPERATRDPLQSEDAEETPKSPFEQMLDDLREQLSKPPEAPAEEGDEQEGEQETEERFIENEDGTRSALPDPVTPRDQGLSRPEVDRLLEQARQLLGEAPLRVDNLLEKDGDRDIFAAHMERAQELLAEGRWFEAEERFSAALRARPGDPMAAAGRVHAQLGAGMFVSAAVNLRNLLRGYPELMNAKFDAALLPQGNRLNAIRAQLRDRTERDTGIARDAGLLLAYLGHQTGSAEDVRDGFAAVRRMAAPSPDDAPAFDELERLLIALWERP